MQYGHFCKVLLEMFPIYDACHEQNLKMASETNLQWLSELMQLPAAMVFAISFVRNGICELETNTLIQCSPKRPSSAQLWWFEQNLWQGDMETWRKNNQTWREVQWFCLESSSQTADCCLVYWFYEMLVTASKIQSRKVHNLTLVLCDLLAKPDAVANTLAGPN